MHRSGHVGRSRHTFHVFRPGTRFSRFRSRFRPVSPVFTVPHVLGVDGTRSVGLRPGNRFRVSVFVFPSTFSPTFQLFAPFRTRWALTGHVPSDFVPVNRFRVTVHVFAQFSAVCTVPDALGVYGTRSTFSPRLTDFAFPSTFSPSFQLFAPFRTRWAFTAHVPRFSPRFTVFAFPSTFSPRLTRFHSSARAGR